MEKVVSRSQWFKCVYPCLSLGTPSKPLSVEKKVPGFVFWEENEQTPSQFEERRGEGADGLVQLIDQFCY